MLGMAAGPIRKHITSASERIGGKVWYRGDVVVAVRFFMRDCSDPERRRFIDTMEDSSYHLVNATELRLSWERSEHASNSRRLTRHAAASNAETIVLSIEKEQEILSSLW